MDGHEVESVGFGCEVTLEGGGFFRAEGSGRNHGEVEALGCSFTSCLHLEALGDVAGASGEGHLVVVAGLSLDGHQDEVIVTVGIVAIAEGECVDVVVPCPGGAVTVGVDDVDLIEHAGIGKADGVGNIFCFGHEDVDDVAVLSEALFVVSDGSIGVFAD